MEIKKIEKNIGHALEMFTEKSGTEVSPHLGKVISIILIAIVSDPHPNWKVEDNELEYFVTAYTGALPFFLSQVRTTQKTQKQITTFDFLHWFSRNFENSMCVIPKIRAENPNVIGEEGWRLGMKKTIGYQEEPYKETQR